MEQLAQFLIHCKNCYAFSKFDVGKIKDELNIPLKSTAVSKKQRATRIILQIKELVQNIHDIQTPFVIISPVKTNSLTTGVKFINPVIIPKKDESRKIVLYARQITAMIDETECNWPIEPIEIILTVIKGRFSQQLA